MVKILDYSDILRIRREQAPALRKDGCEFRTRLRYL